VNSDRAAVTLGLALLFATAAWAGEELLIPRTNPDDTSKYYLLEKTRSGNIVRALSKRVGSGGVGYSLTETNCDTMQMRVLGYSDVSARALKKQKHPTDWMTLEPRTSKSDLAIFVCQ
jgi:hypothetical protein